MDDSGNRDYSNMKNRGIYNNMDNNYSPTKVSNHSHNCNSHIQSLGSPPHSPTLHK